ncbi:MAG: hypothetical protein JW883_10790 [Deltaproteobacteria bacterium]|nr:hypothetical protein [Deltaproteobacteria bacterium]
MPTKARIDAPGAFHHIMIRAIERGKIFREDADRVNFLDRLGTIVLDTQTQCFAWALIPNKELPKARGLILQVAV